MKIKDQKTGKTKDVRLPKKFKEKWVAALRSGEFKQVTGALSAQFVDDTYDKNKPTETTKIGFCCLGVACKIMHPKLPLRNKALISESYFESKIKVPKLLHGSPLVSEEEHYNPVVEKLVDMNDKRVSFKRIANFIEKNL